MNRLGYKTHDSGRQIGYDNQSDELILHPNCPFDYCVNDTVLNFLSTITNIQLITDKDSCVELARVAIVWYWVVLYINSAPTIILPCSFLLQ